MLGLKIDPSSRSPVFRQIVEQIRSLIASGALGVDAPLPTVRELGAQLGVSRLTVHKAYQELQRLGVVTAKTRRGTVVAPIAEQETSLERLLAFLKSGPFPEFERICARTNVRSMASPVPNPRLFDADEYVACAGVLRDSSAWPFYYPDSVQDPLLCREAARFLRSYGVPAKAEDIVPTNGVHPHLSLLLPTIVDRGATVAIQEPHNLDASALYRRHGFHAVGICMCDDGLDVDALDEACKRGASALVASPDFGFMDGKRWTEKNRREVADVLQRHGVKLVERLSLRVLAFDSKKTTPLYTMLPSDLGFAEFSFQHSLAPGIGYAFTIVREPFKPQFLGRVFLSGSVLPKPAVAIATEMLRRGAFASNLERVVRGYLVRRDALSDVLTRALPDGCQFSVPEGGFCAFVRLPRPLDGEALFRKALEKRIAVMPGRYVCAEGNGDDSVVLSYSMIGSTELQEAGAIACRLLKSML